MLLAQAADASDWQQTPHAGSSKPGSVAGRPTGSAALLQHTLLSEMPERERTRGVSQSYGNMKTTKILIFMKKSVHVRQTVSFRFW